MIAVVGAMVRRRIARTAHCRQRVHRESSQARQPCPGNTLHMRSLVSCSAPARPDVPNATGSGGANGTNGSGAVAVIVVAADVRSDPEGSQGAVAAEPVRGCLQAQCRSCFLSASWLGAGIAASVGIAASCRPMMASLSPSLHMCACCWFVLVCGFYLSSYVVPLFTSGKCPRSVMLVV